MNRYLNRYTWIGQVIDTQIEKELKPHLNELQKGEEQGTKIIVNTLKGVKTEYKPKALEKKKEKKDKKEKQEKKAKKGKTE